MKKMAANNKINSFVGAKIFVFGLILLAPSIGFALEHNSSPSIGSLFWPTLNFLIYFALAIYLYRKYGAPALMARSFQIEGQLRKASDVLLGANREHSQIEGRLVNVNTEQQGIIAELEEEGRKLFSEIVEDAKKDALSIERDAQRQIQSELKNALREVREQIIEKAVLATKKKLRSQLSPDNDRRLREEVLQSLF